VSYVRDIVLPHAGTTVSGTPDAVARAVTIDRRMADEQRAWVAELRAQGVKAAHPDDGWVKRDRNTVHLCYPQFDDGLRAGDLLALGRPAEYRIVRVVVWRSWRTALDDSHGEWTFESAAKGRKQGTDA
jgi:hypothetical protein